MTAVQDRTARRSSVLARGGATLAAAGLVAAGLGLGAAPASAAESTVENVSFSWQVNTESGAGAYFGGCNYLVAGQVGNAGSSHVWAESEGFYKTADGNVTVTKPDAAGEQAQPTWATKCQTPAGGNVSAPAGTSSANQVNFAGGTGTVDPDMESGTIGWDGSFTFVFYGGMTYWSVSDIQLEVVNGEGTLTGTASGYGASMDDATIWEPLPSRTIDLATFSGVDLTATGAVVDVDYAGVEVDTSGTPQSRTGANWGSFPQSFVEYNELTGQSSYWYSSGGAADARKTAKPFSVAYTLPEVEVPGTPEGNVDVVIPEAEIVPPVDPETGSFSWAWADANGADLGTAVQTGDNFVATGSISNVAVTDTRAGGTAAYGWTVSGQSTDFSNGTDSFGAEALGWSPKVLTGNPDNVTAGASATGLGSAQKLAQSNAAASATLGADLTLSVPTTTKQGAYSATLTISAIS
ncbi:HtaA domain-containing protein [Pseudoclavibacter terrae]|uniref:HtaA domain-containing protein n=1 Tax=Pseudoclavibacter terrae TaxID=1530195 RepID=UPI00232E9CCA|nr:HtaA domain-containing protein [Pseudoclavibacter terrae]